MSGRARLCRRSAFVFALSSVLAAASASAAAEPRPTLSNEGRADVLFRSGEKKFDSGDYAGACADFSESLKLGPKLGTLLNLALCHETTGKPVTAWQEFSHAAAWATQNNQKERHDFALQHIRALEPKLPRVILQLPADRAIATLDLDGEPLPEQRWYLPLFLDPGEHRLAVSAPGKQRTPVTFRVTSSPSDQLVYIPALADEKKSVVDAPSPAPAPNATRQALGFVGLGVGAAAVLAGAAFGILAMTTDSGDPALEGRVTVSTIAFSAGALLAAAGGILLWSSGPSASSRTALRAAPRHDGAVLSLTRPF